MCIRDRFKYPFFQFGPRYALATGESLLDGYKKLGESYLWVYFFLNLATMFTIQTAVTIVTAGLASNLFGISTDMVYWSIAITIICLVVLLLGKYQFLDKVIKGIILILTISTVLALIIAFSKQDSSINFTQVFPNGSEILFLIAFMGWMPAPLDVSIWNSLWTIEKRKQQKNYSVSNSLFDFNLGYFGTAILGVCFIGVGYFTIYGTQEVLSESAGIFSNQLIHLYTDNLGYWSYYLIAFAAFSTMLSTTITALDASPRAMGITTELIFNKKIKHAYLFWLIILLFGTIIIFFSFTSQMGLLIKIATILSFLTAPFYAIMNYLLISSKYTPKKNRPSKKMHILSILGIIYLLGFSVFFLIKGI